MVIIDDNLPLSAIKVLKNDPAIIGKSLFDTADAGTCGGATPITVTAGMNTDLGVTSILGNPIIHPNQDQLEMPLASFSLRNQQILRAKSL